MTENAVHDAREAPQLAQNAASFGVRHKRGFLIAAIVGSLLSLVGALETDELPFLQRLAYWEILMLSGAIIGLGVSEAVENWGRLRAKPIYEMPLVAALIALPLTFMVVGTSSLFFRMQTPSVQRLIIMFGFTFVISLAITALNYFINWQGKVAVETAHTAPSQRHDTIRPHFADRLPLPMRTANIVALEAEDHYLRVHLEGGGSTLILMRLSDAILEFPTGAGAQTHRSWWVARDAVRGVKKADGRATLELHSTLEVPVSRSYFRTLSDAGWLK